MKENMRKSSIKPIRKHGFRAKPYAHRKRTKKRKPGGGGTKSRTVHNKLKRRARLKAAKK